MPECGWANRSVAWATLTNGYGSPSPPDHNTTVGVDLAFLDFYNLNELAGTIESTMILGLKWEDGRLNKGCNHKPVDMSLELMDQIWLAPMSLNAVAGERISVPYPTRRTKVFSGRLL